MQGLIKPPTPQGDITFSLCRVNETQRGSHLCLKYNTRTANNPSNAGGRMGKCSLTFIQTKFHVPTSCIFPQPGGTQRRREEKPANLAVPGGNCLGVVTAVEAVDAVLKFLADQSLILPAALSIGQPHPLTQVFGVIRGCFATVCCKICKKAQTSAPVVEWLNHKCSSQELNCPESHKTGLGS